jgi:hypothetical protein
MSGGDGTFVVPSGYPDPHKQNVNSLPFGFAYGEGNELVDQNAPTPPSSFAITGHTATSVSLAWDDKAGDSGSYNIYNGVTKLGSTSKSTATISGLTTGTAYHLSVTYVDEAGIESAKTTAQTITPS